MTGFIDELLAEVIGQQVALMSAVARLEARTDGEALHDLRIALRRLRSLLRPIRGVPGVEELEHAAAEVGRLSGPIRDLEVLLPALAAEGLRDALAVRRPVLESGYVAVLASQPLHRLQLCLDVWPALLRTAQRHAVLDGLHGRVRKRLRRQWKTLRAELADTTYEHWHPLRLRIKRVRYGLEAYPHDCSIPGSLLALLQSYPVWLLLRLLIGVQLTVVFILGESWINQLAVEKWRGRLVALYGTGYALSQLSGPVLLTFIGTADDRGFWFGVCLLIAGSLLLLGRSGAPRVDPHSASGRGLWAFCRGLPAIAWAVVLFAAFEAMILTLLPVYGLRQGFPQAVALAMVSTVVVGDALLQLPIGWLADRVSRSGLFGGCGLVLLLSSLAIPLLLQTPLIWPLLVLFGASAGGLFTLALILIGERYRDDALVRANAHVAQLWGIGCLLGPLATGAASQWISGHALPLMMALGAAGFVVLVRLRGAIPADDEATGLEASE